MKNYSYNNQFILSRKGNFVSLLQTNELSDLSLRNKTIKLIWRNNKNSKKENNNSANNFFKIILFTHIYIIKIWQKNLSNEIGKNYSDDIINYLYDYGIVFHYDLHYKKKKNWWKKFWKWYYLDLNFFGKK